MSSLAATLLVFLASFYGLVYLNKRRLRKKHPYPLGPPPLPLIGNLLDLPRDTPWLTYAEWAKIYGDVFSVEVVGRRIIVINSSAAAKDLFEKRGSIYSDRPTIPMFGDKLMNWNWMVQLLPYGDHWRMTRRTLDRGMRPSALVQYRSMIEAKVLDFVSHLAEAPESFFKHTERLQASIIMSMAYGYDVQPENDSFLAVVQEASEIAVAVALPGSILVNDLPILSPTVLHVPRWFPGTSFWKIAQRGRELGELMVNDPISFVKNSMVVSTLLTAFLVLALHPDMQRKAQTELDAVTGRSRPPTFEDRPHLPYVDAFCKELIRWHPIAPLGLPRMVQEDDVYRRYFIPKGALLMVNAWAILRDPETYPNPEAFIPERFLTDDGLLKDNCDLALAPAFGFGRRVCPGRHLADAVVFMTVVSVLSAFDVAKAKDADGMEIPIAGTYAGNLVSLPEPFQCSITSRSVE
ncbi:cytochrome P450 [Auriscalpium vulgare]|uniref:Cytochrome P450 n=1 Tax=Auriscalpium vulgare TaxID=40419 RepID=A0ACB8R7Z1_9AGAM|nr:cytochrome P450 [Auriscalpium vulgare]